MNSAFPVVAAGLCLGLLGACERPATPTVASSTAAVRSPVSTAGQAVDDAVLTTRVKTALLAESSVSGGAISVSSERGQVTLSGNVPADQIGRADAIARRVEGVHEVINALRPAASSS